MLCREVMVYGFKCALNTGHAGPHECCALHKPKSQR